MKIDGFSGLYSGLSEREALESRELHGKNILEAQKREGLFLRFIHVFKEPMFLLLILTATIYFILGEFSDGIIMLVFVLFVSGIEFFQEWKTDRALESLKEMTALSSCVIRDGEIVSLDNEDIVVGDIVILEEGNIVPADGVVLESHDFKVDESILTGESEAVFKTNVIDNLNHFRKNMCYAGTMIVNGSAVVCIEAVGFDSEYGKIGASLNEIKKEKTPLEKQVRKLIVICSIFSFLFFLLVILVHFIYNPNGLDLMHRIISSILSGITIAMATIPEEIPVILTVFLAMGAWDLVKKKALVRHMPAVETLGAVSVLCVDKTGTLTQNQMEVKEVFSVGNDLCEIASYACEKNPYDAMEKAILSYSDSQGVDCSKLFLHHLIYEYAFSSVHKMMGHVWEVEGEKLLCVKGAYETVVPLCQLSIEELEKFEDICRGYASLGDRVLAIAKAKLDKIPKKIQQASLEFVGFIAFVDPPREGVCESLKLCYQAGVRVIMITGDNGNTAQGIAHQIGLQHSDEVVTGLELEAMSDLELQEKVRHVNIFARVYPNHKMRIVEALQKNGEVVAMTGDGVNDAPALKKAEIGIAMGKRGTSVAKEAADMILLDDNFSTIVDSISNGRVIYNNIKKAIVYVLIIHIPIALLSLIIPLFHYPVLLLPIHVVLLELIIDPTSSIIYQRIKGDSHVMEEPVRSLYEPLVNRKSLLSSVIQGFVIFLVVFVSYVSFLKWSDSNVATTIAFSILVLSNILTVYVNQSFRYSYYNMIDCCRDKVILFINFVILLGLICIIYVPIFHNMVGTYFLSFSQVIYVILASIVATHWYEFVKLFRNSLDKK